MGTKVVLALSPAGGVSVGRCGIFMAAGIALFTAAVIVAVKASISMFVLVFVLVSGGRAVAVEVEGIDRGRLGQPCEALPDGCLREDIAFQKV